jgi:uncharacterized protein (TIGR03067 family)
MQKAAKLVAVIVGSALLLAMPREGSADDPALKMELKKLEGTWYSHSTEEDGKETSGEDKADLHIIKDIQVTAHKAGKEISKAEISIEPGKPFGKVKIQMKTGDNKGKTWVGIYKVDEDGLKWCGCWAGENVVPTAFETKKGDKYFLRVMKRQKD